MTNWINYLDVDKHNRGHEGIAKATGELVTIHQVLKHENIFKYYYSTIIRRGMVSYMDWHFRRNLYPFSAKFDKLMCECEKIPNKYS